jgi:hypothetical protein
MLIQFARLSTNHTRAVVNTGHHEHQLPRSSEPERADEAPAEHLGVARGVVFQVPSGGAGQL